MRLLITLLVNLLALATVSHADDRIRHYFENLNSGYELPVHGDYLAYTPELQRLYHERNHQPLWYKNGKALGTVSQLYLVIETITADGLHPEDYHNAALQQSCPAEKTENLAYCDLLFSDAFLLLAQHLLAGKVNPQTLTAGWPAEERRRNLVALLRKATAESKVKDVLSGLRPASLEYQRLMASLKRLRAATGYPEWSPLDTAPSIEPGQEDPRLQAIVNRLVFWGDMEPTTVAVNQYDQSMLQAVQRFQERHGLIPSGVINAATLRAFNIEPTHRAQQIIANLERWRWLDEVLGARYVTVNIAERKLEAVKHDAATFISPIALSNHYRDVPVFSTTLRYVVLNPDWVVPEEQAAAELLPLLESDATQLQNAGFTAYQDEQEVDLTSVSWSQVETEPFPYRFVQAPGPQNALGPVQLVAPNPNRVYLHGAPQEGLFKQNGFSAGSIRVEEPLRLAAWLLEGHVFSDGQLEDLIAADTRDTIYLMEPLPLHIQYRTAWVNNQGVLNFRDDIFERDGRLYDAITQRVPLSEAPAAR